MNIVKVVSVIQVNATPAFITALSKDTPVKKKEREREYRDKI